MVKWFIIIVRLSALRMKGGSVISLSNAQMASQKISKSLIPLVLLFLTFVGVLSSSSLSVDAAQTASGNIPDAGTISDIRVYNGEVVSGSNPPMGGSVIYSVMPSTEYYIRAFVPPSSQVYTFINFFMSYPSLGSRYIPVDSSESFRDGNFVVFHFTTSSSTYFVTLSFRFKDSVTDYDTARSFIKSASIGRTLGLYSPLSDRSSAELTFGLVNPRELRLNLAGFGGVGDYRFTVDINYNNEYVDTIATEVPAGSYSFVLPAFDDDDFIAITIYDRFNSVTHDIFPDQIETSVPDVSIISSPEIDTSVIPDITLSVSDDFANVFSSAFSSLPSAITALLIPCFVLFFIGWWIKR